LNEAWEESHLPITVQELRDARDVFPLFSTGCIWVDGNNVSEAHRQKVSALEKAIIEAHFSDRSFQPMTRKLTSYVVAFQKSPGVIYTTPVKGWFSKMRLLKLHGAAGASQFPGDESTVWTGNDPLGILSGDANAHGEAA
jgi:hypothetical protein